MKLNDILKNVEYRKIIGDHNIEIDTVTQDSRDDSISNGLYFAVIGTENDGHDYIPHAIAKGVRAVVCSSIPETVEDTVCYVLVDHVAQKMGKIVSNFYGNPSEKIKVIAVTGTNGKTSIATFVSQSLEYLNKKTLLLSTAGDYFNGKEISIERKAPSSLEIIELHKTLRDYLEKGLEYCCLEATSQGLHQYRLSGLDIDYAFFTNLADDHLDYHGTMLNYANAKRMLFDMLKPDAIAVSNSDDDYGYYMLENTQARKIFYGVNTGDYIFDIQKMNLAGSEVLINNTLVRVPLVGEFNVYNICSIFALLSEIKFSTNDIINALGSIEGVPGRMQMIANSKNILALVDYAHSSDALDNALQTLGILPHNKIITVIGCGGDRDRTKRAPMARVSQEMSDYVIYTADNPRTEDLLRIFQDMKEGVDTNKENYIFIHSREEAIAHAVSLASEHDIIFVAGKGHEDYQILGTEKIHFDDRETLKKYLN